MPTAPDAIVRLAGPAEADRLRGLRLQWAQENGRQVDDPAFATRFAEWIVDESGRRLFWIAEVGDEPAGMVNLMTFTRMPYPDSTAFPTMWGYLSNLFVVPAFRGHGIGAALIAACTSYADEHDFARVVLSPSEASIPLYERAGFRAADELMVRPNIGG